MIFRELDITDNVEFYKLLSEGAGYDCVYGVTPSKNGLTMYAFCNRLVLADAEGYEANRQEIEDGQRADLKEIEDVDYIDEELDFSDGFCNNVD
jgi:hypothetical protein